MIERHQTTTARAVLKITDTMILTGYLVVCYAVSVGTVDSKPNTYQNNQKVKNIIKVELFGYTKCLNPPVGFTLTHLYTLRDL